MRGVDAVFVILDTNHFTEFANASALGHRLKLHLAKKGPDTFVSVVVAEEALQGWLAFVRSKKSGLEQLEGYARLLSCIETLNQFSILPFDREAALIFHRLESQRLRVGTMDLKIASICLAHDALLLSRNLVDFQKVPGLRVENWLD
jgi:tRNA(fMet)-specific endonuclease VapC